MQMHFVDTSALLKFYVAEVGSLWIRSVLQPGPDVEIYLAQITQAEFIATVCRLERLTPPRLTRPERDQISHLFQMAWSGQFNVIPLTQAVSDTAVRLCQTHPLYGMDAIQLASALALQAAIAPAQVALTFLCADNRLLAAAQAEGLATANPLDHP